MLGILWYEQELGSLGNETAIEIALPNKVGETMKIYN
jgi:hypothetical protein